jgi:sortase (surface protein transpeptidase)
MDRSLRDLRSVPALLLVLMVTAGWAAPASARVAYQIPPRAASAAPGLSWVEEPLPNRSLWRPSSVVETAPAETPKAATKSKPAPKPEPKAAPAPTIVRNHFWIPKLGMSYHVYLFECTRNRPPDNYIYRWGCAGTNNVYILGHAYGVMKPLHDLYVRGGLKVGLVAKYADRKGVVHTYRVTTWRVVDPVDSAWAIASQPVPSMTLQTCVGKDGRYRLNVRLVET